MRRALPLALLLHAAHVLAAPSTAAQVCLAHGVSGAPLATCLQDGRFGPRWDARPADVATSLSNFRRWAERWFPIGSTHPAWTSRGEKRSVRVTGHDFEPDLGVPMVALDAEVALVASGPLDLRVVPSVAGALTAQERAALEAEARRLWARARALRSEYAELTPAEVRLDEPKVLAVPGAPGVRTVLVPAGFAPGPNYDARGSFFFLLDGQGKITFGRFGHGEWSAGASEQEIQRFVPLFFFRIGADPTTYLLADYEGPWESFGLVAILDPVRARVVSY